MSVTLETSMGAITLELYDQHAPKTCHNFRVRSSSSPAPSVLRRVAHAGEARTGACAERVLQRHALSSRDPRLHGPGALPDRQPPGLARLVRLTVTFVFAGG